LRQAHIFAPNWARFSVDNRTVSAKLLPQLTLVQARCYGS